ncbi:diguanylate cyclase domain-containing protein [Marinobacterium aestuariivivens]|uniref:Diguanylate cyclase domain-containing protein n=1 Tax=Marinobacterium aestuariivivens TaxID=1698799 RepID=A0ABW1ZY88_9GAMM
MELGWVLVLLLSLLLAHRLWRRQGAATSPPPEIADYLADAILTVEADGRIGYANPAASHLLGYDRQELIGLCVERLVPEQQRHHHQHWRSAFAATGQSRPLGQLNALAARHKSGRSIPVRISLVSLPRQQDPLHPILVTLYPALDNEEVFEQVQQDAGVGTWEWDIEQDRLSWSRSVFNMFGLDPNRFKASYDAYLGVVHPDDRERVDRSVQGSLDSGTPYQIEYRIIRNGEVRRLLERNYLHRDAQGVLRHMWGSVVDVTEKRRAEARLQLAETVFSHCAEGIAVFDSSQQVVRTNAALLDITGCDEPGVSRLLDRDLLFQADAGTPVSLPDLLEEPGAKDGEWRGELILKRRDGDCIPVLASVSSIGGNNAEVSEYVLVCSDIRQLKEQQRQLQHLAMHDSLTGLPNRRLFAEHLERALARSQRSGERLAVIFADLDGFKLVNDRFGHEAGDELLCQLATRFEGLLRSSDTVARIGGDEFAFILPDCGNDEALAALLARLISDGACPHRGISVTLSLGAACYPDHGTEGAELLIVADQTMYRAKNSGKNRFQIAPDERPRTVSS